MRKVANYLTLSILMTILTHYGTAICAGNFKTEISSVNSSTFEINFNLPTAEDPADAFFPSYSNGSQIPHPVKLRSGRTVPVYIRWVAIPSHGDVTLNISNQQGQVKTFDARGRLTEEVAFVADSGIWSLPDGANSSLNPTASQLEPASAVSVGEPQIMRGVRMVPVAVFPTQYDSEGEFSIANNEIVIQLKIGNGRGTNEAFWGQKTLSSRQSRLLDTFVENSPPPRRDLAATSLARMLVLYPEALEDEAALNQLDNFVEWKRRMGYQVDVEAVDAEAMDGDDIKENIVRDYYEQDPPLDYLVLIGDDRFGNPVASDETPDEEFFNEELFLPSVFIEIESGEDVREVDSDLLFCTLDGDDEMPDISVGRMWVPDAGSLAGALARSIEYERDPFISEDNADWFETALYTLEYEFVDTNVAFIPPPSFRTDFASWTRNQFVDMGYNNIHFIIAQEHEDTLEFISAQTKDALESGVSIAMSDKWLLGVAHPPWIMDEITQTGRMNPFIITNGLHYDNYNTRLFFESATEEDLNGPIAALCTYAQDASNNARYLISASVQAMKYGNISTPGEMFLAGAMQMLGMMEHEWALPENDEFNLREDILKLHLFGDPTVEIFTAIPVQLTAIHPDGYNAGATSVVLEVVDADDNPVANATACIRQVDGIQYVTPTNGDGFVRFTVPEGLEEGELQITVHKHNYRPYVADVQVTVPEVNLVLADFGFDDSELGNDDEMFSNGEEVRLVLSLFNAGEGDAENVTATISADSPYLTFSDNELEFGNIGQDTTVGYSGEISLTLDPDYTLIDPLRIQVDVMHNELVYPISFELSTHTPFLKTGSGLVAANNFFPGMTAELSPAIRNIGAWPVSASTATLTSLDTLVTVTVAERAYAAIDPDPDEEDDPVSPEEPFEVELSPFTFRGDTARFELRISAEDGYDTTLTFGARISGPSEGEPFGPDNHGYYCYDSGDTAWTEAPLYDWREINWDVEGYEFEGTRLDLGDVDRNIQHWNQSRYLPLPEGFNFVYYGLDSDTLVVCSNGWISPVTSTIEFRGPLNYPIPGMSSPPAQICAMWENLRNSNTADNGVFYHHIAAEGIFIIEWSNVQTYTGEADISVSFQIKLFDTDVYPTPTGDSEIEFHYREFLSARGYDIETPFATVGLRNLEGDGGLQYSYWGEYDSTAHPIEDEFAIKFTTVLDHFGAASGRIVTAADPEHGIAGAVIDHPWFTPVTTDEEGYFMVAGLPPIEYAGVVVELQGYNGLGFSFEIAAGETTMVDAVALTSPVFAEITMSPLPFDTLNLRPDGSELLASLRFDNLGDGPLEYSALIVNHDGSDPTPNWFEEYNDVRATVGAQRTYGLTYTDSTFYIAGRVRRGRPALYILNYAGQFVTSNELQGDIVSDNGIERLSWDGTRLWGSYEDSEEVGHIVTVSPQGAVTHMFDSPFGNNNPVIIACNTDSGTIYLGHGSQDYVVEVDTAGQEVSRFELHHPGRRFGVAGMAFNPTDQEGMTVIVLEDSVANYFHYPVIWKVNPQTSERVRIGSIDVDSLEGNNRDLTLLPDVNPGMLTIAYLENFGPVDGPNFNRCDLRIFDLGPNLDILPEGGLRYAEGVVAAGESGSVEMLIRADGWSEQNYRFGIRLSHNAAGGTVVIPVTVTLDDEAGFGDDAEISPVEFGLTALYPNPFNSVVRIEFSVDQIRPTTLTLFDLQGRTVATVYEGTPEIGTHRLTWNASELATGIYFVKLQSADQVRTAKIALIK